MRYSEELLQTRKIALGFYMSWLNMKISYVERKMYESSVDRILSEHPDDLDEFREMFNEYKKNHGAMND